MPNAETDMLTFVNDFFAGDYGNTPSGPVASGIPELDAGIGGGFHAYVNTIIGPPSIGRTTFLRSAANYAAEHSGRPVFFLSMSEANVFSPFRTENKNAFFLNGTNEDTGFIEDIIKKIRERYGIAPVIYIDNVHWVWPYPNNTTTIDERVDAAVAGLDRLAQIYGVPVVVTAWMNQNRPYTDPLTIASPEGDGMIENISDVLLGLQNLSYGPEDNGHTADLVCLKSRHSSGFSPLRIHFRHEKMEGTWLQDNTVAKTERIG